MQARAVETKFKELLMGIKLDGESRGFLREVRGWQPEPGALPSLYYTYRPHDQVTGVGARNLGLETGVAEFIYSWVWELYIGVQRSTEDALDRFMRFDYALAMALNGNPNLGGACYGTSLRAQGDPGFSLEDNRRYLYVPMIFTATAEEGD